MQSLIDYAPFWLAYFAFAVLGFWCWRRVFFMLSNKGDLFQLISIIGAALLFTPAPTSETSQHFAPAIFVLLLDSLSGVDPTKSKSIIWLLASVCLGVFVVLLSKLFKYQTKKTK